MTGDRVAVSSGADGNPVAGRVTASPRADGVAVAFHRILRGEDVYVVPSDALSLLAEDRLDWELFNVGRLAERGSADESLPLIVEYARPAGANALEAQADALPASSEEQALESINGAALTVDTDNAASLWEAVRAPESTGTALGRGLAHIWLDGLSEVSLDQSVPRVGAPQAWEAGYDGSGIKVAVLDTGIDANHPDLAGSIAAATSFVPGQSVVDGHGHGTHVASTIAGAGAASSGRYRGVAPGAQLLVGKVCNNSGSCSDSSVIQGMEWAAAQGADVVNMSLGGAPTDGADPVSGAVNQLSADHGTLFVISAGNSGPAARTVGAPGAADEALTVAAVDKADRLAGFSSRGPRAGDRGLKPDIAAPGVNIVAARAAGTNMGGGATPIDDFYASASGTSMAAPHVAGGAAILASQHPDWTGRQLKDALMSTSKSLGYTAHEQGAGRLDLARAVEQQVFASGNLAFGRFAFPQTASVSKTISYVNLRAEPLTLTLSDTFSAGGGQPAPAGMFTVSRSELTVPAHGSAAVAVTLDPTKGEPGAYYQGAVRAADATGAIRVSTTVGAYLEPARFDLTVEAIAPAGATDFRVDGWLIIRMDGRHDLDDGPVTLRGDGRVTTRMAKGVYAVTTLVSWRDSRGELNYALPIAPEVELDRNRTVGLDLSKAKRITVDTPKPTEPHLSWVGYQRIATGLDSGVAADLFVTSLAEQNYWMLPTGPVTRGSFRMSSQHLLGAPLITMRVVGHRSVALHPRYETASDVRPGTSSIPYQTVPRLPEKHSPIPIVHGRRGLPDELQGLDVQGKLVLITPDDICTTVCTGAIGARLQTVADAGASGALVAGRTGRVSLGSFPSAGSGLPARPLPTLRLPAGEATTLIDRLQRGSVSVRYDGPADSSVYALSFSEDDRIPNNLRYRVRTHDLYRVDARIHADHPAAAQRGYTAERVGDLGLRLLDPYLATTFLAPRVRTEYLGPVDRDVLWTRDFGLRGGQSAPAYVSEDVFDRHGRRVETWGAVPAVPGDPQFSAKARQLAAQFPAPGFPAPGLPGTGAAWCHGCRTTDTFTTTFPLVAATAGQRSIDASFWFQRVNGIWQPRTDQHLSRNGQEIPLLIQEKLTFCIPFFGCGSELIPTFELPPEPGEYQLVERHPTKHGQLYARQVDTTWTFTSRRPTGKTRTDYRCWAQWLRDTSEACQPVPLLFLRYDLGLDLDNTLPERSEHRIEITGYHNQFISRPPRVVDLDLEVSFDDAATWKRVKTKQSQGGRFSATIEHPRLEDTTGAVGLRVHARDADGNTIEQTVERAYGLVDKH